MSIYDKLTKEHYADKRRGRRGGPPNMDLAYKLAEVELADEYESRFGAKPSSEMLSLLIDISDVAYDHAAYNNHG